MNLMSKFWICGGLAFILATTYGCSPRNLEDCLADASKAPTEQGVALAASSCHKKFGFNQQNKRNEASSNSPKKVREVCHVYWDGVRWQKGKTEGGDFAKFSKEFYGVDVVNFALPRKMAESFDNRTKIGEEISNPEFLNFLSRYWHQIEEICDLK
jgi:hypothetical protein